MSRAHTPGCSLVPLHVSTQAPVQSIKHSMGGQRMSLSWQEKQNSCMCKRNLGGSSGCIISRHSNTSMQPPKWDYLNVLSQKRSNKMLKSKLVPRGWIAITLWDPQIKPLMLSAEQGTISRSQGGHSTVRPLSWFRILDNQKSRKAVGHLYVDI